jgi:hypothetical protein
LHLPTDGYMVRHKRLRHTLRDQPLLHRRWSVNPIPPPDPTRGAPTPRLLKDPASLPATLKNPVVTKPS